MSTDQRTLLSGEAAASVPAWFPSWAREFAEQFYAGTSCLFVFHGNVHDLVRQSNKEPVVYGRLDEFLAIQLFADWDLVIRYDLSNGPDVCAGSDRDRRDKMIALLSNRIGEFKTWPRDPDAFLSLLDHLIQRNLMEEDPAKQLRIAVVFDHAQYLTPSSDLAQLTGPLGARLVRLLSWAQDPKIKSFSIAFCLLSDQLSEVNERLVGSPHVATLNVPMPTGDDRRGFADWFDGRDGKLGNLTNFTPEQLAELTSGLNLVSLERLLALAERSHIKLDSASLKKLKKGLIERQARGLVEFVEPVQTLDDFVGNDGVKQRLVDDAALLEKGRLDASPMGYLICGPVGTGKTYLAECFAGSVGVPCVKLRNFRSKYVGETEGNLEQLLTVLRAMGPVVIVIDEADAALGTREGGGDSGTSSRVFSMIASQMGDTRYRGMLIWMLLTSRPDLLPIDLKRQGRAEVHLPLFNPRDDGEVNFMFKVMAKKNKFQLDPAVLPEGLSKRGYSGADIESIVLSAKRLALTKGRDQVSGEDVTQAIDDFVPSAQGLEKEKQELAAVLECTSMSFLPADWKERLSHPDARAKAQERMAAIRKLIEE
ncbi:ATP-binding protein [Paludisphaera borealis]|uniref:ATP-dependent zinc metalloprotease FtsH n=1 Tax=Paludisphaera borealis TaxID=1387353 RepID=A0A1U7CY83_9BACT|nr:AAA family ATPase [Paludisphaera borealis]APW63895.1 ATP-dependent zinc metalloprotease FtsH [Paludisphaera borealis]